MNTQAQLLQENYDIKKHFPLQYGYDAFGNTVTPEEGWALLSNGEELKSGDRVFDIYAGWKNTDESHARDGRHAKCNGRWTTWQRKM